ncbi:MAG: hypothetical protein JNM62_09030 [Flavobacteriales bacterium]|nr:hypothetical protein [Flavobacteriales bacterium]
MKKTRIAPTPSGYLHAGNAFNFLVTAALAKVVGAKVVLRIDDLDAERSRLEYVEDIFQSLEWLGIRVDEGPSGPTDFRTNWSQQLRLERYTALAEELRAAGVLYPCTCARPRFEQMDRNEHPCRTSKEEAVAHGTPWRLRIPVPCTVGVKQFDGTTSALDLPALLPDPIILQRDNARPAYQIASLCDDLEMGITFIVRGADLLPSTACQAHLAQLLKRDTFAEVRFHHHALAVDADGSKLSKSAGSASLKAMREAGTSPAALIAQATAYAEMLAKHFRL